MLSTGAPARIGLFGGTFDPPHFGHMLVGAQAREQLGLSEVLFVPAGDPWQKSADHVVTPSEVRWKMVVAALSDRDWLSVSRLEIDRAGPSYTIDTVEAFTSLGHEVVLILGADAANGLRSWHDSERLASMCSLAIVPRPGAPRRSVPEPFAYQRLDLTPFDVSSHDIRQRVRQGRTIDFLMPDPVIRIIETHGLYRD